MVVRAFVGQSRHRERGSARQGAVDLAGDVTLEAAHDLGFGFALGEAPVHVGDGAWFVLTEAGQHDPPQGVVGVAVAARVEPVAAVALAGHGGDRSDPAELGPGCFGADPGGVVAGRGEQDGGGVEPDAVDVQQRRGGGFHQRFDLGVEQLEFGVEGLGAAGKADGGGLGGPQHRVAVEREDATGRPR